MNDDLTFEYSTEAEMDRFDAEVHAGHEADAGRVPAWILSDRDVWYANPFYKGPPVPHPEDYCGGCFSHDCSGECEYDEEVEIAAWEDTDKNDCPF